MEGRLNWLIYGAGAIGTYIGGSLIMHGQNVVFLEQPAAAVEIKQNGLRLNLHGQEHRLIHPDVYTSLPQVLDLGSFDLVAFALKSYDTHQALETIRPFAERFPPVLCLQNGVENEAALASVLGEDKVIAATLSSAITRRGAGDILLERLRGVGVADGHVLSKAVVTLFSEAGLNARLYPSAADMKWSKLLTNLLVNASTAILDMQPAQVMAHRGLYAVEVTQIQEAIAVMQAHQLRAVNLPGVPVKLFTWLISRLPVRLSHLVLRRFIGGGRGEKMPSFHIDLHSGRGKSEVDYLNGAVVRFGEQHDISTPVNRWLNQTLLALTRAELPLDTFAQQPDKFIQQLSAFSSQ